MVIGFFMPLPLAMMIPFMGIQSAVMAKQFGENFQYGKRRISAMSNDEFNKLTPKMIQDNANRELKEMIPSMQDSISDMRQFQEFMIKEMIKTIGDLLRSGLGFLIGIPPDQVNQAIQDIEHFIHGHPAGHEAPAPSPPSVEPAPEQLPPIATPEKPQGFPPLEVPKEVPRIQPTSVFLFNNAQGRIFPRISGTTSRKVTTWIMQSRVGGTWKSITANSSKTRIISLAVQAWPSKSYRTYTSNKLTYWMLISKVP